MPMAAQVMRSRAAHCRSSPNRGSVSSSRTHQSSSGASSSTAWSDEATTKPGNNPGASAATCATATTSCGLRLVEKRAGGRRLDLVFRAFDDGVGFRYEFPDQDGLRDVGIVDELTEFAVAESATAWWIPAGDWNRYEYLYQRTPLAEVGQAHTPITVRTAGGLHLAFHEAALVDYSAMWLRRSGAGQRLKATLSPAAEGPRVRRVGAFRDALAHDRDRADAPALYESDLVLNLNEPNALGDVSWFKPCKYVGIWWSLHLDTESWGSGPRHGATTANAKRYIDFAAANGFRGVLVEGWNRGWDGDWFADGSEFSFTRAVP